CVNPSSGWKQVTAAATAGHSVTLTLSSHDDNYAGDPTYTQYDSVTVTTSAPPSNDFSIASSPTGATVTAGSSTTATVSTAVTSGSAATGSLSTGGAPGGGTSTITITGTEGSATHSATFALTVTSGGGGGGITNGGFETGTFSGWTT